MTKRPGMKHDVLILRRASAGSADLHLMVDQIVCWVPARHGNPGSLIFTTEGEGGEYHVQETPDEILDMIWSLG